MGLVHKVKNNMHYSFCRIYYEEWYVLDSVRWDGRNTEQVTVEKLIVKIRTPGCLD